MTFKNHLSDQIIWQGFTTLTLTQKTQTIITLKFSNIKVKSLRRDLRVVGSVKASNLPPVILTLAKVPLSQITVQSIIVHYVTIGPFNRCPFSQRVSNNVNVSQKDTHLPIGRWNKKEFLALF